MRSLWPNRKPCVIVASIGRSGSSIVTGRLKRSAKTVWLKKTAWFSPTLATAPLLPGTICKTHDLPDALTDRTEAVKALFIFGSTLDSALSVQSCIQRYGPDWGITHLKHLKSTGHIDDLFKYDVGGLGAQIKSWATFDGTPTLCVRYDALWDNTAEISRFTGYRFKLPVFKQRSPKQFDDTTMAQARRIYGPIDDIVMKLPPVFMAGPHMADQVAGL